MIVDRSNSIFATEKLITNIQTCDQIFNCKSCESMTDFSIANLQLKNWSQNSQQTTNSGMVHGCPESVTNDFCNRIGPFCHKKIGRNQPIS